MTDQTVIQMVDGSKWSPSTSSDKVHCVNCGNIVDTPEEIASYPNGKCPECGEPWTGAERKDVSISVTVPQQLGGEVL
jgi:predicted RNA-binding Zn-ribbon protein involved in translation (DUF1610 family)